MSDTFTFKSRSGMKPDINLIKKNPEFLDVFRSCLDPFQELLTPVDCVEDNEAASEGIADGPASSLRSPLNK